MRFEATPLEKATSNCTCSSWTFKSVTLGMAVSGLLLSSCAPAPPGRDTPSALDPRGLAAGNISELWWIMFWMGLAVFVVVTGLFLYALYTRGRQASDDVLVDPTDRGGKLWIWWGGIILPAIILAVVLFFSLRSSVAVATPPSTPALTLEITGRRWFWDIHYVGHGFFTSNEIHIPVGQPVQLYLTSDDVIHSFWVPQLHGKMDLNPGEVNSFWIQADEPGIYRGICAEFCGLQHANMQFLVVAEEQANFDAWLAREQQEAPLPEDEHIRFGQQVFLGSSCVYCHTVRGTNATGRVGPDLTHIASRLTLAAGILENNRGNLAGWIVDPQHIKPGNLMPPTNLSSIELQALLDYLSTLE